jgi:hypothetical protein
MDYTPPPWKTHAVNYINGTPAQWEIRDTRQGVIAITENLNPDDAALIAAAPDLLAACIEATSLFDNYPECHESIGTLQVLVQAINKATYL